MSVDVLGEILTTLELSSQIYFRAELAAPFAIAVPEEPGVIRFHVTAHGPCHIDVNGTDPVMLRPGDLALVPHGAAHVLADAADRSAIPLAAVLDENGFDGSGPLRLGRERPPSTVLVCGHFAFAETLVRPIPASLPPLMVLRGGESRSWAWIEQVIRSLEGETRQRRIGSLEVVRRLSEIMLIEVLRAYADHGELTALAALADPQLGRALEAIHSRLEEPWSLDALARAAGMSRTRFAERFRDRMGVAPMKYLTTWRMQKARSLLARTGCSVAEAARRVGYASESAFHHAFREEFDAPPGCFRRPKRGA